MAQECPKLIENGIDGIHVDVMEDEFVPNLAFNPNVVAALRKHFPLLFIDCHLMVQTSKKGVFSISICLTFIKWIEAFAKAGASSISMHIKCFQSIDDVKNAIYQIKNQEMKCGIAFKPETPVEIIIEIIPLLDFGLMMTVSPGFGCQKLSHVGKGENFEKYEFELVD